MPKSAPVTQLPPPSEQPEVPAEAELLALPGRLSLDRDWWTTMLRDWPDSAFVSYLADDSARAAERAQCVADQQVRDDFAQVRDMAATGRHHRQPELPEPEPDIAKTWESTPEETAAMARFIEDSGGEGVADSPVPGFD